MGKRTRLHAAEEDEELVKRWNATSKKESTRIYPILKQFKRFDGIRCRKCKCPKIRFVDILQGRSADEAGDEWVECERGCKPHKL